MSDQSPSCEFGLWEQWSKCSKTCGGGIRTRERKLFGDCGETNGPEIQNNFCLVMECPSNRFYD